jgi:DNA-binding NarL/FixJ family response regulator
VFLFKPVAKSVLSAFIPINGLDVTTRGEVTMTTLSDLTNRELEILQLVLAGYTNKAIAAEIYISEKTVEFHLDNLYTKIGVRTRLMAGVWAVQQGIGTESREIPS